MKRIQQTEPEVSGKVRERHATVISLKSFNASLMAESNPGPAVINEFTACQVSQIYFG